MAQMNRPEEQVDMNTNAMMNPGVELKEVEGTRQKGSRNKSAGHAVAEMLKEDHRKVKQLFSEFESAEDQEKPELCRKILMELKVHTKLEEELVYPSVKEQDHDLILEAVEEHGVADFLIGELERMSAEEETFDAKVKVLGEVVKHHIQEEEKEMMQHVEKLSITIEEVEERKDEIMADMQKRRTRPRQTGSHTRSSSKRRSTSRAVSASKGASSRKSASSGSKKRSTASSSSNKKSSTRGKSASSAQSTRKPSSTSKARSSSPGRTAKRGNSGKSTSAKSRSSSKSKKGTRSR